MMRGLGKYVKTQAGRLILSRSMNGDITEWALKIMSETHTLNHLVFLQKMRLLSEHVIGRL